MDEKEKLEVNTPLEREQVVPEKKHVKEIILSVVGVLLLVGIVMVTSYAVFTYLQAGTKENTITTGTVTFSYNETENGITLVNAQPITDTAGKSLVATDTASGIQQGYFDFTVTGTNTTTAPITYEVYATLDDGYTFDPNYLKVYLSDASTETAISGFTGTTVPTYNSLTTASSDTTGKRLYTETFTANNYSKTFRLRIWVADTYTLASESKTVTLRVNVKATM